MRRHTKNQPSAPGRPLGRWIRRLRVRAVTFTTLPYLTPAGIVTECAAGFLLSITSTVPVSSRLIAGESLMGVAIILTLEIMKAAGLWAG